MAKEKGLDLSANPSVNTKRRGRGRPKATNGVTIFPKWHNRLDMSKVSRTFIEFGLALAKRRIEGVQIPNLKNQTKLNASEL